MLFRVSQYKCNYELKLWVKNLNKEYENLKKDVHFFQQKKLQLRLIKPVLMKLNEPLSMISFVRKLTLHNRSEEFLAFANVKKEMKYSEDSAILREIVRDTTRISFSDFGVVPITNYFV